MYLRHIVATAFPCSSLINMGQRLSLQAPTHTSAFWCQHFQPVWYLSGSFPDTPLSLGQNLSSLTCPGWPLGPVLDALIPGPDVSGFLRTTPSAPLVLLGALALSEPSEPSGLCEIALHRTRAGALLQPPVTCCTVPPRNILVISIQS